MARVQNPQVPGGTREAFVRATDDLKAAAKDRDLDGAALHYTALAMSCYQCHRYIKNARVADGK